MRFLCAGNNTNKTMILDEKYKNYISKLKSQGLDRALTQEHAECLDFSHNDYLLLSKHPALIKGAQDYAAKYGAGAQASRLLSGNLKIHEELESQIAKGKGAEASLVFCSGFQANVSVIAALLDRRVLGADPLVFTDRLNHASMHVGCQMAGVRQIRYRHLDLEHLENLLKKNENTRQPKFILTESLFGMDGDYAPIEGYIELAKKHGAFLFVDDAHSTGIMGKQGYGLTEGFGADIDLIMGTFSKGMGCFGAYVTCSQQVKDYLLNTCRGLIYTTAPPPPMIGAMQAAWNLVPSLGKERESIAHKAAYLRKELASIGVDTGPSCSHIVPILSCASEDLTEAKSRLEEDGILTSFIRPPTAPTARLRVSVNAGHSYSDLDKLASKLQTPSTPINPYKKQCS